MLCQKCNGPICAGETIATCEGFCEGFRQYHARCVGLTEDEGSACLHRNIFWFCNDCHDLMENVRFRNTVNAVKSSEEPIKSDLKQMKTEILHLSDMVGHLMESIAGVKSTIPSILEGANRLPSGIQSSPLSSTKLDVMDSDRNVDEKGGTTVELHLSNIANDVTENEVENMVIETVGRENFVSIKSLVPSWKNGSSLDWISFKVVVDRKCRESAMKPVTWPKGVRCREFKNYSVDSTWRPNRNCLM